MNMTFDSPVEHVKTSPRCESSNHSNSFSNVEPNDVLEGRGFVGKDPTFPTSPGENLEVDEMNVSSMSAEIVMKDDTILTNRGGPPSFAILQLPNFGRATLRRSHNTFIDVTPNDLDIVSKGVLKAEMSRC